MNIAIHDIDKKFPNYALMKISAYYKSLGHSVENYIPLFHDTYNKIYASSVFTYADKTQITKDMITGGTGFDVYSQLPKEIENTEPDYSLYNYPHAVGFLTRGCIRKCSFCVVPKKEGGIKPYRDIEQVLQNKKTAVLMDNNILACDYGIDQINKISKLGIKVDFNQGLDHRLIDNSIAKRLSKVKWLKPIRLALDNEKYIPAFNQAVDILRANGCTPKTFFCYVLVDDIESALKRVEYLRGKKIDPFAQPFLDLKTGKTQRQFKHFARWVNHKAIFKTVKWNEYNSCNNSR